MARGTPRKNLDEILRELDKALLIPSSLLKREEVSSAYTILEEMYNSGDTREKRKILETQFNVLPHFCVSYTQRLGYMEEILTKAKEDGFFDISGDMEERIIPHYQDKAARKEGYEVQKRRKKRPSLKEGSDSGLREKMARGVSTLKDRASKIMIPGRGADPEEGIREMITEGRRELRDMDLIRGEARDLNEGIQIGAPRDRAYAQPPSILRPVQGRDYSKIGRTAFNIGLIPLGIGLSALGYVDWEFCNVWLKELRDLEKVQQLSFAQQFYYHVGVPVFSWGGILSMFVGTMSTVKGAYSTVSSAYRGVFRRE